MLRVYISGAATREAYDTAASDVGAMGYEIAEARVIDADEAPTAWPGAMRAAIGVLLTCDIVVALPGYRRFRGASIECQLARDLAIAVVPFHELKAV
jgi:hypothetical protein